MPEKDSARQNQNAPTRAPEPITGRERSSTGHSGSEKRQQSAADLLPHITLPKGGGAIRGIGEKFSVNAPSGTAGLTVPLPLSPGRSGFTPELNLSYNSGGGNGPFGYGWSVGLPAITRKTDKGLPRYEDARESDTFILSGAEDLVPVTGVDGVFRRSHRILHKTPYDITSYFPRVEGGFAQIERWTDTSTGISHWRSINRSNVTSLFGFDPESRIAAPDDPCRVFEYKISRSWDDKGNIVQYNYKRDDDIGVDLIRASEAQRSSANRATQTYIKSVRYGNIAPWYPNWGADDDTAPLPADWAFEFVLDYGDHQELVPTPTPDRAWPARDDAFSTYRSEFEVRTSRLCRRFLMFHTFAELGSTPSLVKSLDLTYMHGAAATFLRSMTTTGYLRNPQENSYAGPLDANGRPLSPLSLPALEFSYTEPTIDETIRTVNPDQLTGAPGGVDGRRFQWVDLDGEGLPGILSEAGNAWHYNRNVTGFPPGSDGWDGPARPRFEGFALVGQQPSTAALSQGQQLVDLASEGHQCLVEFRRPMAGFYDREPDGSWTRFTPFAYSPNIAWTDPNLKHIDLDGDGHPDLLISEDEVFNWYPSLAKDGFGPVNTVRKPADEDRGPAILFADGTESIVLADMSGDGLTDIARIRNGEVCYWPNLGFGLFGAKVTMDRAPAFDTVDQFDQKRIRLADIDGSGTSDIIYLGRGQATFWFNESGNGWSEAHALSQFPDVDNLATVAVIDLLGSGTSCIVWSSPLPGDSDAPMRYIDLMAGGKPHLLTSVKNNLGAETRIRYAPSTRYYLQDRAEGRPWITRLAFPVQVVERSETYDYVSGAKFVSRYAYHHGYFDGVEREFRGFGMVEQWDADTFSRYSGAGLFTETPETAGEEFHLPAAHSKTWFHTGAFIGSDRISRQCAHEYYAGDPQSWSLPDSRLPDTATADEAREACRALRGHVLRQEVYADDGTDQQPHPYAVTEHTYRLRMLQRRYENWHCVVYPFETETISAHYERNPADPRVEHQLTLEVDEFGNVTKSAAVGYPRRPGAAGQAAHAPEQVRTLIVYKDNTFTNCADEADWRRLGLGVEARTFELIGVKLGEGKGPFRPASLLEAALSAAEIPYEARADSSATQKRLLHRSRTAYLKNDLSGPLPAGKVESLALPYESYQLALTPGLVNSVFASKMTPAELTGLLTSEGRYVDLDSDGSMWIPSGHIYFSPEPDAPDSAYARAHFYHPVASRDSFGNLSRVDYDSYNLAAIRTTDALGNVSAAQMDYRVLAPSLVTDPNGNLSAAAFDAMGMVTATAVMGKDGQSEGDTLADPTTRLEYDLFNWQRSGKPNFVHAFVREQHGAANPRWQEAYSYSDGLGREVMKKRQAPSGPAPVRGPDGALLRVAIGNVTIAQVPNRWIGDGRTVQDNKGNPVKKYEPYFSSTAAFEDERELVEQGVTPILRYDPIGRLIRTDMPDGTLSRVEFDPWLQRSFDANDTVLTSRWYATRVGTGAKSPVSPAEQRAAKLAATHANTPTVAHFDTLGRTFLSVADNGAAGQYETRSELDIEGQTLSVTDARGNCVLTQVHDMAGAILHHASMDAGENWGINDVAGKPMRSWNSRGFQVRTAYDALHRPTQIYVKAVAGTERLAEKSEYGESLPDAATRNLRGQLYQHSDAAGIATQAQFDFKGNLLLVSRQLLVNYKDEVDWSATPPPALEPAVYSSSTTYDALNRPVTLTTPDGSVSTPTYDEANHLLSMSVSLKGAANGSPYVASITYNAKGQRERIVYGNGVTTSYDHDPLNYRLRALTTFRSTDNALLQKLAYTYDPVGNIVEIRDDAQQTLYFRNQVVAPANQYEYDPIYRLISATGREHVGQGAAGAPTFDDAARSRQPHPNDGLAMTRYVERYEYDSVGNIQRMLHNAGGNGWSRRYDYDRVSNRLNATSLPADPDGVFSGAHDYDEAGNMTRMPHLPLMRWDYKNELQATSQQVVASGSPETTYYVYAASGERVRKVTERAAPQGGATARKEERIYLGGFEVYRSYTGDGAAIDIERETLHIMDDKQRIALVETRTQGSDPSPAQLARYQFGNHLGSAVLELDEQAQVISYEEYYPYGCTSYQAVRSQTETPKRYRYTGKERDEESGFYYHGARYYAPWLGRWTACDPAGMVDGPNVYGFVLDNPVALSDWSGRQSTTTQSQSTSNGTLKIHEVRIPGGPLITGEQLRQIMPELSAKRVPPGLSEQYASILNNAMEEFGIDTPERRNMFLAQLGHESIGLSRFRESGSDAYFLKTYGTNKDIIPKPKDPSSNWYIGRGGIQVTGRRNYLQAENDLNARVHVPLRPVDLVAHPANLETDPELAIRASASFWSTNNLNGVVDKQADDLSGVLRVINSGEVTRAQKGDKKSIDNMADRARRFRRIQQVLGDSRHGPATANPKRPKHAPHQGHPLRPRHPKRHP